jgi:type VI secretion system protein VasD
VHSSAQLASCAALALLYACSGAPNPAPLPPIVQIPAPQKKPVVAELEIIVESNVNPDLSGRPSPVIVRTYELKSLASFDAANFFTLLDRDKDVLGAELNGRDELPLAPGERREIKKTLQRDTRFLAVTAAFRDVERAQWRAVISLPPDEGSQLEIRLDLNDVSIKFR